MRLHPHPASSSGLSISSISKQLRVALRSINKSHHKLLDTLAVSTSTYSSRCIFWRPVLLLLSETLPASKLSNYQSNSGSGTSSASLCTCFSPEHGREWVGVSWNFWNTIHLQDVIRIQANDLEVLQARAESRNSHQAGLDSMYFRRRQALHAKLKRARRLLWHKDRLLMSRATRVSETVTSLFIDA